MSPPQGAEVGAAPPDGVALTWRWTLASVWIYIVAANVGPVSAVVTGRPDMPRAAVIGVLLLVCLGIDYRIVRALRGGFGRSRFTRKDRLWMLLPGLLVVAVLAIDQPGPIGPALIPWTVASLLAADLSSRARLTWLFSCFAVILAIRWSVGTVTGASTAEIVSLRGQGEFIGAAAFLIGVTGSLLLQTWLWDLVLRVQDAGHSAAELARVRERLRFAADLHDIQGHHLQVIALKTELAERLIDVDPVAARSQIVEAQEIARQAMSETRGLVRGYRSVTLAEEAANAAAVLEAAGARCHIDLADAPAGEELPLLGSLLREATTNVLRHSAASTVWITLSRSDDEVTLVVRNDRPGAAPEHVDGSGIAGLAERFAAAGGSVASRHDDEAYQLTGVLVIWGPR